MTKEEILKMSSQELADYCFPPRNDSIDCNNCFDCYNCYGCNDCFICNECDYCNNCYDCSNCNYCSYCKYISNAQFMICNIQLTEEEYDLKMKQLGEQE